MSKEMLSATQIEIESAISDLEDAVSEASGLPIPLKTKVEDLLKSAKDLSEELETAIDEAGVEDEEEEEDEEEDDEDEGDED